MKNFITLLALILFIFTLGFSYKAKAHDVWLSPEKYNYNKGDTLIIHQLAGHLLNSEKELPFIWSVTPSFQIITKSTEVDLIKEFKSAGERSEIKPVVNRNIDFEGQAMISMVHSFYYIEIDSKDFDKYLEFEELTEKYKDQLKKKPMQQERFARSIKNLIQVGDNNISDVYNKNLGHKIEILLLNDPVKIKIGDKLKVKVLYDNKPLSNQLVFALNKNNENELIQLKNRTNKKGEVKFKLGRGGEWLIRLTYLRHCSEIVDLDCSNADWESQWAAYNFYINQ